MTLPRPSDSEPGSRLPETGGADSIRPHSPIRTGIVGFGLSGRMFHAPFILTHPDFELDAVLTRVPARRAELVRLAPTASAVDSLDALLARDLDLVVIGSPTGEHAQHVRRAIEAGAAVIVDKPLAPTRAEAAELFALAESRGAGLTVFQNRRFDDDFTTMRRLLDDGTFGAAYRLESRFERFKTAADSGWRTRATPADGGGLLLDLGTHVIDQAIALLGPVERVAAARIERRLSAVAEDDVFLSLEHASGAKSDLWMNSLAAVPAPRFRLLGTEGGFASYGLDPQEDMLKAGLLPGDPAFLEREGRTASVATLARSGAGGSQGAGAGTGGGGDAGAGATLLTETVPLQTSTYLRFYDRVSSWLRGESGPPVTKDEALAVLGIIDRARELTG